MSEDGASSVVVIAMLGNVFSPRYARARGERAAHPLEFCTMNVAVDTPKLRRWALTERGEAGVARSARTLRIGRSAMRWEGGDLVVAIDEECAPFGQPLRGTIRFTPRITTDLTVALDPSGRHTWSPIAPMGDVRVDLTAPGLAFGGTGYLDSNAGDEGLEAAFDRWSWSRVSARGEVAIAYDLALRSGGTRSFGFRIGEGGVAPSGASSVVDLGRTRFGLTRQARVCEGVAMRCVRTIEDGPFYARSLVETRLGDARAHGVHETVSLARFVAPWVRFLVPFRMRVEAAS